MSRLDKRRSKPVADATTTTHHRMKKETAAPAVLSVESFAHRKGVTKGLITFKERKEKKRMETAKALRSYRKVMKQEGFEAGSGASRKRDAGALEEQDATQTIMAVKSDKKDESLPEHDRHKRKPRTSRFYKSSQQAVLRKEQQEISQKLVEERQRDKQQALQQRRQRHKLLTERSTKGQPIMKNIVHDILNKLEREKSNGGDAISKLV